jgi:hypothetical protein
MLFAKADHNGESVKVVNLGRGRDVALRSQLLQMSIELYFGVRPFIAELEVVAQLGTHAVHVRHHIVDRPQTRSVGHWTPTEVADNRSICIFLDISRK